jgi:hypothetical protein
MDVTEIMRVYRKTYDILKVENALVKFVYYVTEYAIFNLISSSGWFTMCQAKGKAQHF